MLLFQRRPRSLVTISSGIILIIFLFLTFFGIRHTTSPGLRSPRFRSWAKEAPLDDIFNSTLGFGKIFVVNLPARTDHHDAMLLTAAATNMSLDWIDGVRGEDVSEKALPPGDADSKVPKANIGSWRAHMDAMAAVVQQNLGSALILEDDADWDIRIKRQLRDYALASRALTQPLSSDPSTYADPTYLSPRGVSTIPKDMYFDQLPSTVRPLDSPYGDEWDILWLGHCGASFPNSNIEAVRGQSIDQPKGRVVQLNDETVPPNHHLHPQSVDDDPRKNYPPHTRFVHHPVGATCSLVYAVTQASARRILYEMALKDFSAQFDIMLRECCEGTNGREIFNCLTVQPQLFNHHRPIGKMSHYSDISHHGDGISEKAVTEMIRWSARMNLKKLLKKQTDYEDQFPDAE